ncbi:MAG: HD domain-containing protein [Lachnospiraceae bacterium]|nr:HD domain-containing protein [Lachnospiraceae bacterium]
MSILNTNNNTHDTAGLASKLVYKYGKEILNSKEFEQQKNFFQHGDHTVYKHSVDVAKKSAELALKYFHDVDYSSLIRGALLHDYFLYDWHEKNLPNKIHGFTHPSKAAKNAARDFGINHKEKIIIKRHMFPLTPIPPTIREAWIICIADKMCATHETVRGIIIKIGLYELLKIFNQRHHIRIPKLLSKIAVLDIIRSIYTFIINKKNGDFS